ncbi:MAG: type IV conjugative transfer system coupling protein TraD [Gammaproteobacteria bacterium]|nr:type IV conjugative transfer system coupling protein TraD [Gammaproteobacteria bacterium]
MSTEYPLEALLRPPVELWSALVAALGGGLAFLFPTLFMLTPGTAYGCGLLFFVIAIYRATEGWMIARYHRNLRQMSEYTLVAKDIPISYQRLFFGKGFRWEQKHTQRLRDTLRPWGLPYVEPKALYLWARRKEQEWENKPFFKHLAIFFSRRVWWNPLAPLPPVGGSPQLHAVELREEDIWMDLKERVGHILVLGTTRVGKTRLCEVLVSQDIRRGDVVILFDPKGDAELLKRMYVEAKRCGREKDFYMFHLGYPDISARYNAIGNFSRVTEVATRIATQIPSEGEALAFREFAWRFTNIIARALVALGRRPDYQQISQYVTNIEPLLQDYCRICLPKVDPDWLTHVKRYEMALTDSNTSPSMRGRSKYSIALVKYIKEKRYFDPVVDGLRSAFEYDKTYFDKLVATLMPLMEKLITGKTAELISPNYFDIHDPRPIFDWMQVIRKKAIVYVGLDALSDTLVSGAVGNSMFADLVSVAGQIYKFGAGYGIPDEVEMRKTMPTLSMHCDEFNEIIGDEFIPLLNKAGGAGVQVTAYTQTWSDIESRVRSVSKAGQVIGNFNTIIMMRVREYETAEILTKQLPLVEVASMMTVAGTHDVGMVGTGSEFSSVNQDRVSVLEAPMLTPADIVKLPKGQAFVLMEGAQLYKIRLPLIDSRCEAEMPESIEKVSEDMERRYTTSERWWLSGGVGNAE